MEIRLQKFLAEAGVASRRQSERFILEGRVAVNGAPATELGRKIDPARDRVTFDGKPLKPKRKIYLALHKPREIVSTRFDPQGRRKLGDLLPAEWSGLNPVGRLDYQSEGLIFLTNDGEFLLRLTHPRYGIRKKYLVRVEGKVERPALAPLLRGIEDAGEMLQASAVRLLKSNQSESLLEVELAEGKNRELRRMMEQMGWEVLGLQRIAIGPIKLGELPPGKWRILQPAEVRTLMSSVK